MAKKKKKPGAMNEWIEWIPVTREMPDDDTLVMMADRGCDQPVWMGWHAEDAWWFVGGADENDPDVTHWAHLPKGPDTAF